MSNDEKEDFIDTGHAEFLLGSNLQITVDCNDYATIKPGERGVITCAQPSDSMEKIQQYLTRMLGDKGYSFTSHPPRKGILIDFPPLEEPAPDKKLGQKELEELYDEISIIIRNIPRMKGRGGPGGVGRG